MICDVFRLLFFCFVHFTLFRHWIQPFCYCCCCWCGDVARVVDPIKFELTTSTRMKYSGSYLFNAYLCVCCACACAHKIARLRPVETSCFSLFDYEHSTHTVAPNETRREPTTTRKKVTTINSLTLHINWILCHGWWRGWWWMLTFLTQICFIIPIWSERKSEWEGEGA